MQAETVLFSLKYSSKVFTQRQNFVSTVQKLKQKPATCLGIKELLSDSLRRDM